MALDIYVGTMTRFYRREWENVAQRMFGAKHHTIYAGGTPEPPSPAEDIRQAVKGWCKALSGGLEPHGYGPVEWDEGDDRPYFTDRPAWDGYSALLVWAAHSEHPGLPWPSEIPKSWLEDPAYQKSTASEFKTVYRTILEPQIWLPIEFPFVFEAPTLVSDRKQRIGSAFALLEQLDNLHKQTAGPTIGLKPGASVPTKSALADMAAFSLRMFRDLAKKACEHRLPILLDF